MWLRLQAFGRAKAGFTLVEAMVALAILAIGLLGACYALHVSYFIDDESVRILHHSPDKEGKVGLRGDFNKAQSKVYEKLK